jgi:hypothetical protein
VGWPVLPPPPGLEDTDLDPLCAPYAAPAQDGACPAWQSVPPPAMMQMPAVMPTSHLGLRYTQQDLTSMWARSHQERPPWQPQEAGPGRGT